MEYKTVNSKITFLKMESAPDIKHYNKPEITISELRKPISLDEYRKIYSSVGKKYNWLDRIFMADDILYKKINNAKTHIYPFYIQKNFAGYCELVEIEEFIEILYFGLTEEFIGKGYGNYILGKIIEKAWGFSPAWIQLNTCDLDHSNALPTYINAGFKPYKTVHELKKVKIQNL